jgi:hypothetical protein
MADTNSIVRRRDVGSTGTQFAEKPRRDATEALQPGRFEEPVSSWATFTPNDIGEDQHGPVSFIDVYVTGDGTTEIKAVQRLRLSDYASPDYLGKYSLTLDELFWERYGADIDLDDDDEDGNLWGDVQVQFRTTIHGEISRPDAYLLAREKTSIDQLFAESDRTTEGESLGRLLKEYVDTHFQITDDRGLSKRDQLTTEQIDASVELRAGEREISDATALAIATRVDADKYPVWARFGRTGVVNVEALRRELSAAYQSEWGRTKDRANMMFTYLLHGGDNA